MAIYQNVNAINKSSMEQKRSSSMCVHLLWIFVAFSTTTTSMRYWRGYEIISINIYANKKTEANKVPPLMPLILWPDFFPHTHTHWILHEKWLWRWFCINVAHKKCALEMQMRITRTQTISLFTCMQYWH